MTILGHAITWHPHVKGFAHSLGGSVLAFVSFKIHQDTIQFLVVLASLLNGLAAVGYPVFSFIKFVMRWMERKRQHGHKRIIVTEDVKWGPNG